MSIIKNTLLVSNFRCSLVQSLRGLVVRLPGFLFDEGSHQWPCPHSVVHRSVMGTCDNLGSVNCASQSDTLTVPTAESVLSYPNSRDQ